MSYTKTTWSNGDTITAEKLNHAEDGIEAAVAAGLPPVTGSDNGKALLVSNGAWGAGTLPKDTSYIPFTVDFSSSPATATTTATYEEIMTAYNANKFVAARADMGGGVIGIFPFGMVGNSSVAFWGIIPIGSAGLAYVTLTVFTDDSVTPGFTMLTSGQ